MKYRVVILCFVCIAVTWTFSKVELKPLHGGIAQEYGQMNNLTFFEGEGFDDAFTINRTIGWFAQSAVLDRRVQADLVLAGLFFHFFPYNAGFDYSKVRNSAVSIDQATATYKIGDWDKPDFSLSFGLMRYKYSESKNLGEYLFRSSPYPTTTINGSWDIVHSSFSKIKAILLEKDLAGGSWKNDLLFFISDELYPLHDLNLAWVTSLTLGPLELGAGVNFYKFLPSRPSRSTPEDYLNSYFDYAGETYYGDDLYYKQASLYFKTQATKLDSAGNAIAAAAMTTKQQELEAKADLVDSLNDNDATLKREYYTYKGTLLMGRFSLNLGALFGDIQNFKLYGEADLLGLKNYPIFFDNVLDRLPIMLGISLPTWGFLDYLNFEVEYWENPFPIILYEALLGSGQPKVDYKKMSEIDITKPYEKDNWKWNVSAQRSIGNHIDLSLQIANDHTRPIRYDFSPYPYETMLDSKAWYYLLRLQLHY